MPRTAKEPTHFALILDHYGPGKYLIADVAREIGTSYNSLSAALQRFRHPLVKPYLIDQRRIIEVLPNPKIWTHYIRTGPSHGEYRCQYIPPP